MTRQSQCERALCAWLLACHPSWVFHNGSNKITNFHPLRTCLIHTSILLHARLNLSPPLVPYLPSVPISLPTCTPSFMRTFPSHTPSVSPPYPACPLCIPLPEGNNWVPHGADLSRLAHNLWERLLEGAPASLSQVHVHLCRRISFRVNSQPSITSVFLNLAVCPPPLWQKHPPFFMPRTLIHFNAIALEESKMNKGRALQSCEVPAEPCQRQVKSLFIGLGACRPPSEPTI